jgi:hypothetical protein
MPASFSNRNLKTKDIPTPRYSKYLHASWVHLLPESESISRDIPTYALMAPLTCSLTSCTSALASATTPFCDWRYMKIRVHCTMPTIPRKKLTAASLQKYEQISVLRRSGKRRAGEDAQVVLGLDNQAPACPDQPGGRKGGILRC